MAKAKITYVALSSIIERENSQRTKPAGVEQLADSIKRIGLLHPIIIDEQLRLVAGGNRLAAYRLLGATDPAYAAIPTTQRADLSNEERRAIELEENIKRTDLDWKDETKAIVELDLILQDAHDEWTVDQRASYVGLSTSHYQKYLVVGRAVIAGHERVLTAGAISPAYNIIEKERARTQDNVMNTLYEELGQQAAEKELPLEVDILDLNVGKKVPQRIPSIPVKAKPARVISQGNFSEWAPIYTGPKFNLIHCDFPYGIDHGNSDQGGATSGWDAYEDGEDIYWHLVETLLNHRENFMLPSCHILFWFHMKFYQKTIDCFNRLAPEMEVDYFPLIWHKTDNKGIIRNAKHTARHVYETAFLITRGERQIIKAVGDAYGAPTRKSDASHISEKPVPVLRHFMQLCVDGFSEVLDPTAGGGSALRAAHSMGAKRVQGIELNSEYADGAQREFEQYVAIESLRKVEA